MALRIEDRGRGNVVTIGAAEREALQGHLVLTGDGAAVTIGPGCLSSGLALEVGTGARVVIGAFCHLSALFVHASAGTVVEIGNCLGVNGLARLLLHEPGRIAIGANGLIAGGVDITVSDMHSILDQATGRRINPARDVMIGDRVWLGQGATVLKGAVIGHDSVIGAGAVVTGAIPAHCVAAGVPARVVRTGVTWCLDLV